MRLNGFIYVLCLGALAVMPDVVSAQQDSSAVRRNFNATDYLLQDRYIPKGRNVRKNARGKNFSIGAFGGVSKLQGAGSVSPVMGEFGIMVTKDVNSFNSYGLSLMGGKNTPVGKVGVELDHIFRIQDYLWGWDPDHKFYLETVWGVGAYGVIPQNGETKFAWGLHGGVALVRRISSNLDFFIEPRLNFYSDNIDAYSIPRKYDVGFQAVAGVKYRFTGYKYTPVVNFDLLDNFFYEVYAGTSGDFSQRVKSHIGKKTLGPAAGVSAGKWIYPIGYKGTLFGGWRYTPNDRMTDKGIEPYVGFRIEGMVNLNSCFVNYITDPKLELNLLGGYEIGYLAHKGTGLYRKKINMFHGPTLAAQAVYFVRPDLGVFALARWEGDKYKQEMMNNSVEKRVMKNIGLELGVQYRRRYEVVEEHRKYAFEPYSFVSAQIGTNFPLHSAGVTKDIFLNELGQQFSISYGRRYSRLAAVRATLEAGRYGYKNGSGTYPLTIGGDIMFDALSVVEGYMPERIVTVYPFVGLLYTHNETADENNFGVQGGVNINFSINDEWCVYGEGAMKAYKGQITPSAKLYAGGRISFVPNISVGLAYRF